MAQATLYGTNQIAQGTTFIPDSQVSIDSITNPLNLNLNFQEADIVEPGTELKITEGYDSTDTSEVTITYTQL